MNNGRSNRLSALASCLRDCSGSFEEGAVVRDRWLEVSCRMKVVAKKAKRRVSVFAAGGGAAAGVGGVVGYGSQCENDDFAAGQDDCWTAGGETRMCRG